jgi:biopolymer transport protein TolR
MVAAPLMIAGVPVNLPQTAAARQNPPQKPLVVSLVADGALYIRDRQVNRAQLMSELRALRATEGDAIAYVRADRAIAYGEVMAVLGDVGAAGYSRISLLVQPVVKQAP